MQPLPLQEADDWSDEDDSLQPVPEEPDPPPEDQEGQIVQEYDIDQENKSDDGIECSQISLAKRDALRRLQGSAA